MAEAAQVPKAPLRGKTRKLRVGVPKEGANDVERMKYFYQMRAKDPVQYTYTPEGDLRMPAVKDMPAVTIPLRYFSGLEPEERQELETRRTTDLLEIEAAYEESLLTLREAIAKYREGGQLDEDAIAVVRANEEVRLNSKLRSDFAYPSKWIKDIENPTTSDILLNQRYEERKMGFDVFLFKRQDLSKDNAWGHYRASRPAEGVMEGGGNTSVLFITDVEDKQTGIFHPAYIREFVFSETQYVSPYQAFEAERFKELGNETIRKQILGTRSARTISNIAEKEDKQPANPNKLWEAILDAFYTQHTDLAEKLKETGSAKFHTMDKQIGSQVYVDALEKVRTRLREDSGAEKATEIAKESAITVEEQKKARTGAIIHNFRRRG